MRHESTVMTGPLTVITPICDMFQNLAARFEDRLRLERERHGRTGAAALEIYI